MSSRRRSSLVAVHADKGRGEQEGSVPLSGMLILLVVLAGIAAIWINEFAVDDDAFAETTMYRMKENQKPQTRKLQQFLCAEATSIKDCECDKVVTDALHYYVEKRAKGDNDNSEDQSVKAKKQGKSVKVPVSDKSGSARPATKKEKREIKEEEPMRKETKPNEKAQIKEQKVVGKTAAAPPVATAVPKVPAPPTPKAPLKKVTVTIESEESEQEKEEEKETAEDSGMENADDSEEDETGDDASDAEEDSEAADDDYDDISEEERDTAEESMEVSVEEGDKSDEGDRVISKIGKHVDDSSETQSEEISAGTTEDDTDEVEASDEEASDDDEDSGIESEGETIEEGSEDEDEDGDPHTIEDDDTEEGTEENDEEASEEVSEDNSDEDQASDGDDADDNQEEDEESGEDEESAGEISEELDDGSDEEDASVHDDKSEEESAEGSEEDEEEETSGASEEEEDEETTEESEEKEDEKSAEEEEEEESAEEEEEEESVEEEEEESAEEEEEEEESVEEEEEEESVEEEEEEEEESTEENEEDEEESAEEEESIEEDEETEESTEEDDEEEEEEKESTEEDEVEEEESTEEEEEEESTEEDEEEEEESTEEEEEEESTEEDEEEESTEEDEEEESTEEDEEEESTEEDEEESTEEDEEEESTEEDEEEEEESTEEDEEEEEESTEEDEEEESTEADESAEDTEENDDDVPSEEDEVEEEEPPKKAAKAPAKIAKSTKKGVQAKRKVPPMPKLTLDGVRKRDHIADALGFAMIGSDADLKEEKLIGQILKDIKKAATDSIKPLEKSFKFSDISQRILGDAEIFNKPMALFLGPWSSGKSTMINYLLGTDNTRAALKAGPQPTDSFFTVIHHNRDGIVRESGLKVAGEWAFSGVNKFGQAFLSHFRGIGLNHPLLQKVTIVDTPGVIDGRRFKDFPLEDVFQWFIDRADAIYVVFDPSKLEIGADMKAMLDQLRGKEQQTRFLLNKADLVEPSEVTRVTGQLLWNVSPLLGSSDAPTIYTVSMINRPYLPGSPAEYLKDQEEEFLTHLKEVMDERVENTIMFARRHAVRVRNHAKLVDCYLDAFYKHKGMFGNKKKVAEQVIKDPAKFNIFDTISQSKNISRYDLLEPEDYAAFFKLNPLHEFSRLKDLCGYVKGCPIDKLDRVIAIDLPQLLAKYLEKSSIPHDSEERDTGRSKATVKVPIKTKKTKSK